MKQSLSVFALVVTAACAPTSNPAAPSLGAVPSGALSQVTGIPACSPTVAAPGWVTINQSSFAGPLVVEFERRGGHTDFQVEIDRRHGDGTWNRMFTFRTYALDLGSVDYRPSIDGTYRARVRPMGRCEGSWSDYVLTGVDGFEADSNLASNGRQGGRGGHNHGWGDHSAGNGQGHD
jgi:hypothetical protein